MLEKEVRLLDLWISGFLTRMIGLLDIWIVKLLGILNFSETHISINPNIQQPIYPIVQQSDHSRRGREREILKTKTTGCRCGVLL